MKYLALYLFVSAIFFSSGATSSLGWHKCSWGPVHWCKSLPIASSCRAVSHCVNTTWSQPSLHAKHLQETDVCRFSQKVVKTARKVGNDEKHQLISLICRHVEYGFERKECKDLVKHYKTGIFQLIESDLEPAAVATVLGFCKRFSSGPYSSSEDLFGPPEALPNPYLKIGQKDHALAESTKCTKCRSIMARFHKLARHSGSEVTVTALFKLHVCKQMAELKSKCNAFADEMMPAIVERLAKTGSFEGLQTVCSVLTMCSQNSHALGFDLMKNLRTARDKKHHVGSLECDACKRVVEELRSVDRNPTVQNDFLGFFYSLCDRLGLFAKECKIIVHYYGVEAFEFLAAELEPSMVCQALFHCHHPELKLTAESSQIAVRESQHLGELKGASSSVECELCELVVGTVDRMIRENRTEAAIQHALDDICKKLPSAISAQCLSFVNEYAAMVVKMLQQELDAHKVCVALGLCPAKTVQQLAVEEKKMKASSEECKMCELVVGVVDQIIGENRTEAAIQHALDDICEKLPSAISAQCLSFVNEYAAMVVKMLQQELDAHKVCVALGLCPAKTVQQLAVEEKKMKASSEECKMCELVVGVVDQVIGEKKTEAAIQHALDDICEKLPSVISGQCLAFVNEYTALVVKMLQQELDAHRVCAALSLCPAKTVQQLAVEEKKMKVSSEECKMCELVVGVVDQVIGEKKTEAAIQHALDDICEKLPSVISGQCLAFVNEYTALVVKMLQQELDAHRVCAALSLCPAKTVQQLAVEEKKMKVSSEECKMCELVVGVVDQVIGEKRTEAAIQHALDDVCKKLPSAISAQCVSFVNEYAAVVVKMLQQELDAHRVCAALGLCPAKTVKVEEKKMKASSEECKMCELVVGVVDQIIGEKRTEAAIQHALDDVCKKLSSAISAQCVSFVNEYSPMVVKMLQQELDAHKVCVALGLCPAKTVQTMVLKARGNQEESENPFLCTLCKFIVAEFEKNTSDEEVIKAVEKVCDVVEGDLRLQCISEVQNYGPAVLDLLRHMETPSKFCTAIKLCGNSYANSLKKRRKGSSLSWEVREGCHKLMQNPGNIFTSVLPKETQTLLKGICSSIVPKSLVKPSHRRRMQRKRLGKGSPCSHGPFFWCASIENAQKCGMVRKCVEKYGMNVMMP